MQKRGKSRDDHHEHPFLLYSRDDARHQLRGRIQKGNDILSKVELITNGSEFTRLRQDYYTWSDFNEELLKRMFSSDTYYEEYRGFPIAVGFNTLKEKVSELKSDMESDVRTLDSIMTRLELIPESPRTTSSSEAAIRRGSDVFIVHGSDDGAKDAVARFVGQFDIKCIILNEQPNSGRTIIEKFEDSTDYSNVGFAVVLMTPDDIGARAVEGEDSNFRARQNVIFELGFFVGKLGRKHVCALRKGDVEIPSDYSGVMYIEMDDSDGWKLLLAKELKSAGIPIDLNKAV